MNLSNIINDITFELKERFDYDFLIGYGSYFYQSKDHNDNNLINTTKPDFLLLYYSNKYKQIKSNLESKLNVRFSQKYPLFINCKKVIPYKVGIGTLDMDVIRRRLTKPLYILSNNTNKDNEYFNNELKKIREEYLRKALVISDPTDFNDVLYNYSKLTYLEEIIRIGTIDKNKPKKLADKFKEFPEFISQLKEIYLRVIENKNINGNLEFNNKNKIRFFIDLIRQNINYIGYLSYQSRNRYSNDKDFSYIKYILRKAGIIKRTV